MKAVVIEEYGSPEVLQVKEVEQPKPTKKQILIKVHATSVNSGEWRVRKADPFIVRLFFGLTKPRFPILGTTYAGVIESIGEEVTNWQVGQRVFGMTGMKMGSYAEYLALPATGCISEMPDSLDYLEAATIPFGGITAACFLKRAKLEGNNNVLVYGASGAVGTAAVQLAKAAGAKVTAVCSGENAALVKGLGADEVLDYKADNFKLVDGAYDLVFETVDKCSLDQCLLALKKGGTLILGSAGFKDTLRGAMKSSFGSKKVISGVSDEDSEHLEYIKTLLEKKAYKAVVDKQYPLEEMRQAHTYVEAGHKKGNVAIKII